MGGQQLDVDTVIWATGFQPGRALVPVQLTGRGGVGLAQAWKGGAQAYFGTTVHGFPNLFLMTGPNVGLGHNSMIYMMEAQYAYILDAWRRMRRERLATVEVKLPAQQRFMEEIDRRSARTVWLSGGCRSWYLDAAGRNRTLWPGLALEYRWRTRSFDIGNYETTPNNDN